MKIESAIQLEKGNTAILKVSSGFGDVVISKNATNRIPQKILQRMAVASLKMIKSQGKRSCRQQRSNTSRILPLYLEVAVVRRKVLCAFAGGDTTQYWTS